MAYSLTLTEDAIKDLSSFDKLTSRTMLVKLVWLADNAQVYSHQPLSHELAGSYKLYLGNKKYRAVYNVIHDIREVVVLYVERRDKVYK